MSTQEPTFSHSGQRYLLGYTAEEYGIWDRQTPGPPVQRFPKSDAGWNQAWSAYQGLEAAPAPAPAAAPTQTSTVAPATPASSPTAPTAQLPASGAPAMQYPAQTPAAAPRAPLQISNQLLASVLNFGGWAVLLLLPLTGIAWMTNGGFTGVTYGLAWIALGPILWAIGQTLAKWVSKNG